MPFDLGHAIAAWRRMLRYRRAFSSEDLDELEAHLRDHVEQLVAQGRSEQEAFSAAVQRLGDAASVEDEYRKVFWTKVRHRRRLLNELTWEMTMLKNYVTVALRNLRRHTGYTFINVSGLALGMACALLIALFVRDEMSYDRYHDNADRVYRVTKTFFDESGGAQWRFGLLTSGTAVQLEEELPAIEAAVEIYKTYRSPSVAHGDRRFVEDRFFFASAEVFDVFTMPFVQGDPETALTAPQTVVLTASMAEKYFGGDDPVGRVLTFRDNATRTDLTVTGVIADAPHNTHFHYDFLASFETLVTLYGEPFIQGQGSGHNFATYVLLPEGYRPEALEAQFPAFIDRHGSEEGGRPASERVGLSLQPVTDIHLHSNLDFEIEPNSDIAYVYLFSAVGLLILLIACINFMNLATARSAGRAREVGMRKVLGAQRGQLIRQFLGESVLLTVLALGVALALVALALPAFRHFIGRDLSLHGSGLLVLGVLAATLGVGLLAGSYPAFFLSAFRPVTVLKGTLRSGRRGKRFRTALVVTQFSISIVLMVGTAVVFDQLDYVREQRLGFDEEHLLVLPGNAQAGAAAETTVRQRLAQHPNVVSAAISSRVPSDRLLDGGRLSRLDAQVTQQTDAAYVVVDHAFFDTYGMELLAGRSFSKDLASDSSAFVLNEAAVRALGWTTPEAAIGQTVTFGAEGEVIGVVEDVHFESMHQAIGPIAFVQRPFQHDKVTVRLRSDDLSGTLAYLEDVWRSFRPDYPFDYTFLDTRFDQLYRAEEQVGQLAGAFALLAIVVACLGLFGLATYLTQERTKEIGVRKVLGATVPGLVALLSKDFLKLVAIAFVVAVPVAYLGAQRWLRGFAYHVDLSIGTFLLVGLTALGIALLTVSYQSVKAALIDPVKSLRYE